MLLWILLLTFSVSCSPYNFDLSDLAELAVAEARSVSKNFSSLDEAQNHINFLRTLLGRITEATVHKTNHNKGEVSIEIESKPRECSDIIDCRECVSSRCGWCISQRACRKDEAWQCQGDVDHVGLSGIGKFRECPNPEDLDRLIFERVERREKSKKYILESKVQEVVVDGNFEDVLDRNSEGHLLDLKKRSERAAGLRFSKFKQIFSSPDLQSNMDRSTLTKLYWSVLMYPVEKFERLTEGF
jgi:hypothetical protein